MVKIISNIAFFIVLSIPLQIDLLAQETLSLEAVIKSGLSVNPEILAAKAKLESEKAMVRASYSLDSPRVGLMLDKEMDFSVNDTMTMYTLMIEQEMKFPLKYIKQGVAQKAVSKTMQEEFNRKRYEVRQRIIAAYYNLFAVEKNLVFLNAEKDALRQIAHLTESLHTTGKVTQQDEMKVHIELTKFDTDIMLIEGERDSAKETLRSLLAQSTNANMDLSSQEILIPKFTATKDQILNMQIAQSPEVRIAQGELKVAKENKSLANLGYLPDFMFGYRRAFNSFIDNDYEFSVLLNVPLWFFMKETAEVSSAKARVSEYNRKLENVRNEISAEIYSLFSKTTNHEKLLNAFELALIPQARSTLEASRAAYQAGRVSILELLDSERTLFSAQTSYYRILAQFADYLAMLEEKLGKIISNLPTGELS